MQGRVGVKRAISWKKAQSPKLQQPLVSRRAIRSCRSDHCIATYVAVKNDSA